MTRPDPLPIEKLYTVCDSQQFTFATTAELKPLDEFVGQDRAVAAVRFAMGMDRNGYNLFAYGPEGVGKTSLVRRYLEARASSRPIPHDWVYVHNFAEPHRPRAFALPPASGRGLAEDMDRLIDDLRIAIPSAFEGEEYRTHRQSIEDEFKVRGESSLEGLQKEAAEQNVAIVRTQMGLAVAPTKGGEIIKPEEFEKLSDEDKAKYTSSMEEVQKKLQDALSQMPAWEKEHREQVRDLGRQLTEFIVGHLMETLHKKYEKNIPVATYLKEVHKDIVDHASDFLPPEAEDARKQQMRIVLGGRDDAAEDTLRRYRVNVVVDNCNRMAPDKFGAPVLEEDHPTLSRLVGRIEHSSRFGMLVTDFMMIKPGALHEANGGHLVIDARKLLTQPYSWEALKRALTTRTIRIEGPNEMFGMFGTTSLEPEPIPLDIKIILIGEPDIYYALSQHDPEFTKLFKIAADFESSMDRDSDATMNYARLASSVAAKDNTLPLTREAVARTVEHGARLADDSEKLTTQMSAIADLIREADYWAREGKAQTIDVRHIQQAIDAQLYRAGRIRERMQEQIERNTIVINTDGVRVGEVNGLAVYQLDHVSFGKPSRISARVHPGRGGVIDIEREVALGGALHTKGVLILSGYLAGKYSKDAPLALSANLVFEQSYGGVDGDSASSTELYALISAISEIPLKQSIAVTGSVDQNGRVQAIGGVNEKIEGFFDICAARGLTGEQGVMIPASNVKHLMLRKDVVEACTQKRFAIYPVATIDQGIEILTGMIAGEADEHGEFPLGSVNREVVVRLDHHTKAAIRMARDAAPRPTGGKNGKRK
jgi:lon-related putative ATP-dependent protease